MQRENLQVGKSAQFRGKCSQSVVAQIEIVKTSELSDFGRQRSQLIVASIDLIRLMWNYRVTVKVRTSIPA